MHLLHLEDSPTDAELISIVIRREWPACAIKVVATAAEYRSALAAGGFDLVLSDYSLPGFDGLAALEMARARFPEMPFLFLSGTIGEERAVEALKRGATDYILKDQPTRLIPAIRQAFALLVEADRRRRTEAALRISSPPSAEVWSRLEQASSRADPPRPTSLQLRPSAAFMRRIASTSVARGQPKFRRT